MPLADRKAPSSRTLPEPIPDFDLARALAKLEITLLSQKPFAIVDGNTQGYAVPREHVIAISPIAFDPTKTGIHEAAHVLLHGDEGQLVDTDRPERSTREVEAELTAYLVKAALGIDKGQEFSQRIYSELACRHVDGESATSSRVRRR